jgi:hypothetical protein
MYWFFPDTGIVTDRGSRGLYTLRRGRSFGHPLDILYPVFVGFRYLWRSLPHPGSGAWNASEKPRRGWFRSESQWRSFPSGEVLRKWVDNTLILWQILWDCFPMASVSVYPRIRSTGGTVPLQSFVPSDVHYRIPGRGFGTHQRSRVEGDSDRKVNESPSHQGRGSWGGQESQWESRISQF